MIKFIKNNKLLFILIVLTLITLISGIFFNTLIDISTKKDITNNINNLITNYNSQSNLIKSFIPTFSSSLFLELLIWIFGISIIGCIIVLFLFLFKVFIFGFELVSLLVNLKIGHIIFIVIYMLPSLFNLVIYFILTLFSISYSISLFKILFLKKNYNLSNITKKYIKILGVSLLFNLLSSIIEVFILPKILIFLI